VQCEVNEKQQLFKLGNNSNMATERKHDRNCGTQVDVTPKCESLLASQMKWPDLKIQIKKINYTKKLYIY
jgi:hypothetical protein